MPGPIPEPPTRGTMESIRMQSMRMPALLTFALLLPFAAACDPAPDADRGPAAAEEPAGEPAPAGLRAATDRYVAAWNGDDPAALAELYTDDATATAFDHTLRGRDEIERGWLQNVPIISDLRLTEESVRRTGDDWRSEGRFALTVSVPDADPFEQTGDYGITWTREAGGEWRIRASELEPDGM
jgi:uncharacterized protein (TIGR02246 family)